MKFRALIVDDMALARRRIVRQLEDDAEIEVVGECGSGREAIAAISAHGPDIVFLDVQMPEVGGFEVLEAVGADAVPAVVFVTAFDQFALRAFEVHALDYLLKPFDAERMARTLERAKQQIRSKQAGTVDARLQALLGSLTARQKHLNRLALKVNGRMVFVPVEEIDHIEAAGNYVRIQAGGESHMIRERLSEMERRLDPDLFARIHRSTIVNVSRIKEMQPLFNGDQSVLLKNGKRLTMSRTFRERLMSMLERR